MFRKEMKLKCTIGRIDETGRHTVTTKMFDGTEFTLKVFPYEVVIQEEFAEHRDFVDGWLFVVTEGQQGNRVAITLPQPSDVHGRQVTVSEYELTPRNLDIGMFNPEPPVKG